MRLVRPFISFKIPGSQVIPRRNLTNPVVNVQQGKLKGKIENTWTGTSYASFKGVPFAAPPIRNLRFAAPQPPTKWTNVKEAYEHAPAPMQKISERGGILRVSEDCLYLNVYTPDVNGSSGLPVVVVWPGGSFLLGAADTFFYGPDYLIDEGIVVVTVNYRMGSFGFLSLHTERIPGNAGLKDQTQALRWIRDNIRNFGGDPDNVTLMAESAGAIAISCHMVSPMSKGLFHKAILQSGSFFCGLMDVYSEPARAKRLAQLLGFTDIVDRNVLASHLINAQAEDIVDGDSKLSELAYYCVHGPVVENQYPDQECFLPENPLVQLNRGDIHKVPTIIGHTSNESVYFIPLIAKTITKHSQDDYSILIPPSTLLRNPSLELRKRLAQKIVDAYQFGKKFELQKASHSIADMGIIQSVHRFASEYAKLHYGPVYFYRMSYDDNLGVIKRMLGYENIKGLCHFDDIFYLFKSIFEINVGDREKKAITQTVKMWSNFIKNGNPTPENDTALPIKWKSITDDTFNYIDIDHDITSHVGKMKMYEFWSQLYALN